MHAERIKERTKWSKNTEIIWQFNKRRTGLPGHAKFTYKLVVRNERTRWEIDIIFIFIKLFIIRKHIWSIWRNLLRTPAYERAYETTHASTRTHACTPYVLNSTTLPSRTPDISTHTRGHTQTCTCVLNLVSLLSFSLSHTLFLSHTFSLTIFLVRVIYVSAFTGEYMPMYVRVHIQSTSRLCSFSFLVFFLYGDYNFVTAFDWKKKQQGTRAGQVINVITVSSSSPLSYLFPRATNKTLFHAVQNIKKQRKQQRRAYNAFFSLRRTQRTNLIPFNLRFLCTSRRFKY